MKKIFAITLAIVLTLALFAACGGANDNALTPSPAEATDGNVATGELMLVKSGTLTVGMEIGYPPMEYKDTDGVTPIGFDVEFANALADKLGLAIELQDTAWDAIFESLNANRYDAIISSVSINPDRQENFNITKAYIANNLVLVTKKDSTVTSPDDLAGLRLCAQTATTASEFIDAKVANDGLVLGQYLTYDKIINCFDELKAGRVDAVIVDKVVASYYLGDDAGDYKYAWESPEPEPMGIALKKGNDALTAAIETAVEELYADGTMAELSQKWFGEDITKSVR